MTKAIGGYFGLELKSSGQSLHDGALFLNSGRTCFEYILKAQQPKHVYLPKFTCDVMLEPLKKLSIPYTFYIIDKNLELAEDIELSADELIVYTNYFGVKDNYCDELSSKYRDKLVLDCSQALYYSPNKNSHIFYSPRKFFGLPDGGILYTSNKLAEGLPTSTSFDRISHLLKRVDAGPEAGYGDFKTNEAKLRQQPMAQMSALTKSLYDSFYFDTAKQKRNANFKALHQELKSKNKLEIIDNINGPMCYPFVTDDKKLKQKLIDSRIFVATYWPNVLEWSKPNDFEYELTETLIPLPIDQRYDNQDMKQILDCING